MGKSGKKAVFGLAAVAAIAIPATVIAGSGTEVTATVNYMSTDVEDRSQISSKTFTPVPTLVARTLVDGTGTVSADMVKGKAEFRISPINVNGASNPDAVTFAAPGSNAHDFTLSANCDYMQVEWRRLGDDKPAVADSITLKLLSEAACG